MPIESQGFAVANDTIPELHPAVEATSGHAIYGGSIFRWQGPYVAHRIGIRVTDAGASSVEHAPAGDPGMRLQVAPNPTSGPVALLSDLPEVAWVRATIHDPSGRIVRHVHDALLGRGTSVLSWDGRDGAGRLVSSGLYLARVKAGMDEHVVKIIRR